MWRLLPLLLAVFIDSLGFGLVVPVLSPLIFNQENSLFAPEVSLAVRGFAFGVLIASFCLGQFFGGPVLGALSDNKGRKKILLWTIWLGLIGYLFAAFGIMLKSIILLFIARVCGGVAAGNYGVAQSVAIDNSPEHEKGKNFGLVGMSWWSGFVIGPYFGGKLSQFGLTVPFWIAAVSCLFSGLYLKYKMQETFTGKAQTTKVSLLSGIKQLKKAIQHPALRGLFLVMFVVSLGWGFFTEFSPIFLIRYFKFDGNQIGNFYAWLGLWIALCQGILIRPFLKRYSLENVFSYALLGLGIVLPIMLIIEGPANLFWLIPFIALGEALIFPTASTLVSNVSGKEVQGEILSIHNSVQWAAIGISPLFSGSLVAIYPHLPITICSVCMLFAFLLTFWLLRKKKQSIPDRWQ